MREGVIGQTDEAGCDLPGRCRHVCGDITRDTDPEPHIVARETERAGQSLPTLMV